MLTSSALSVRNNKTRASGRPIEANTTARSARRQPNRRAREGSQFSVAGLHQDEIRRAGWQLQFYFPKKQGVGLLR